MYYGHGFALQWEKHLFRGVKTVYNLALARPFYRLLIDVKFLVSI